jgi:hypothetical protein
VSGINVPNRTGVTIQNCHITLFDSMGIAVVDSSGIRVVDNLTIRNVGNGVFVARSPDTSLVRNEGVDNGAHGSAIHDTIRHSAYGNRVYENDQTGFQIVGTIDSRFEGNFAERNESLAW